MLAAVLLLVVTEAPGQPHSTPAPAGSPGADLASDVTAPACGMIGHLVRLHACGTAAGTNAATTADPATCNLVEQLLGMCTNAPATDTGGTGTAPSTTTTTTTSPASVAPATPAPLPDVSEAAGSSGPCSGTTPPIAAPSGGWSCTFDDEFNGTSLDTSKWQPQLTATSSYTTGPMLDRVCYVNNPQTISESGGTLNLSIVRTAWTSCPGLKLAAGGSVFEGGTVDTYSLFSQQYGYFEVRAAMPATSVPGLQETLWLYPENETLYGAWPDSGEIDFAEFYSDLPSNDYPVLHYPGSTKDPNASVKNGGCTAPGASPAGQFNTYALSWTPTTLTTYFNGVPCFTDDYGSSVTSPDTAPEPFNQPFFMNFTAALGMGGDTVSSATPLPATTEIDWARVWQYG